MHSSRVSFGQVVDQKDSVSLAYTTYLPEATLHGYVFRWTVQIVVFRLTVRSCHRTSFPHP